MAMPTIEYLKQQLERARRFAASFTNREDRERFGAVADDYQRQIDAASARSDEGQGSVVPTENQLGATTATSEAAPSDAVASTDETPTTATGATGEQPTGPSSGEQPETD